MVKAKCSGPNPHSYSDPYASGYSSYANCCPGPRAKRCSWTTQRPRMSNLLIHTLVPYKTYTLQTVHADPVQTLTSSEQNEMSQLFELSTLLTRLSQKMGEAESSSERCGVGQDGVDHYDADGHGVDGIDA